MNIVQFLRIIWARRVLILAAAISCVIGGYIVTLILPARWPAHSRVMLNTIKPDPVTGQIIQGAATRSYVATQVELIRDYSVAGPVVDELGWLNDAGWINAYAHRSASDKRDMRRWVAQQVIDRTKADLIEGSNILEITYDGQNPEQAQKGADAIRAAYMEKTIDFRRDDATRNADWYDQQGAKIQAALLAAETRKAEFEKQSGVVLAQNKVDPDTTRLQVLAMQGAAPAAGAAPITGTPPAATQLAEIDAAISEQSKNLGPNHPEIQALKAKRAIIQKVVQDQERTIAKMQEAGAANAANAGVRALDRALEAQKARVLAEHDKVVHLQQLQDEVDRLRELYNRTAQRAADFRQEGAASIGNLTPLGSAVTPKEPSFPNYPLVLGGSAVLGLGLGVLVAILCELFARRVRGVEDLETCLDVPMLTVVAAPATGKARRMPKLKVPEFPSPSRRKVVQA